MAWLAPRPGNRQARDRHRLAPQGVQTNAMTELAAQTAQPEAEGCAEDGVESGIDPGGMPLWLTWPRPGLSNTPSTRTLPWTDPDFLAAAVGEAATAEAALAALRQKVGHVEAERRTGAASAASHAEPYIRKLCSTFVDPIDSTSMTDDDLLVVALKIPPNANIRACMSFGPSRARTGSRLRARRPYRSKVRRSSSWCPTHCWRRSRNSALRPGNSYPSDAQTGAFGITWRPPQLQFTVPPCRKRERPAAATAGTGHTSSQ